MKMFAKIITVYILFVAAALAADECGVCMVNMAACVNNTSYRLCVNEIGTTEATSNSNEDVIYNCKVGEYCTNSTNICEPNPDGISIVAVCDQTSASCSTCAGKTNGALICLSATQFAICRDNGASQSNPLTCPTNQLCSEDIPMAGLNKVCAPQVVLDYLEATPTCNIEGTVTPPTTTVDPALSTTPMSESALTTACTNANQNRAHFQIPHSTSGECKKYIYCERNGNTFIAFELKCRSGQFYSQSQNRCIQATRCPN